MITKNQKYGISDNVTIADFGTGDIIVADGIIPESNTGCLTFVNDVSREIGTDHPERVGKTTDELKEDIIFTFSNVESVDVVLGALERTKAKMLAK